jgi:hypothetical protein
METQIWSKVQDKWAFILVLRGSEVHRLKVTGNVLTLKRNVKAVMEALQAGRPPAEAGAKSGDSLDARTVVKAEVSPGNDSLTLHGGDGGLKTLTYATGDSDADAILRAILDRSGRAFQPRREEVGAVEAVIPPGVLGVFGGLLWFGVFMTARQIAAGEHVEVRAGRRAGLRRLLTWAAEALGPQGTLAVGVLLLALVLGWAALRLVRRPERTVWLPEAA